MGLDGLPRRLHASPAPDELWPEPHDRRFDFPATADGAEWIDELALAARRALAVGSGEVVVGHSDWRVEHARFEGGDIVAAHDWQSLAVGCETGAARLGRPRLHGRLVVGPGSPYPDARRVPRLCSRLRGGPGRAVLPAERMTINAAWVYATAYGARCEHSDARLGYAWAKPDVSEDSYRGLLARHGAELLA